MVERGRAEQGWNVMSALLITISFVVLGRIFDRILTFSVDEDFSAVSISTQQDCLLV